ncbi:MAG: ABC transporter permease [Thermoanaerobaculum sp.]
MREKLIYDSEERRHPMVESALELRAYPDLLRMLVAMSITTRYKRSLLGVFWTLLNPLLHMVVLTVAFSTLFGERLPRYPVYVLSGLMVFEFFSQTTTYAVNQLVWGSPLLGRVFIPAAVFPLSAVGAGIVNFFLTLVPLLALMVYFQNPFSWALLLVPLPLLLLAMLSLGFGLLLAAVALSFNDAVNMWGVLVRAWYFLTPVMYPETIFPQKTRWLLETNPLYHLLRCIRDPIYSGHLPDPHSLVVACLWSVATLVLGWWVFSARRFQFALQV